METVTRFLDRNLPALLEIHPQGDPCIHRIMVPPKAPTRDFHPQETGEAPQPPKAYSLAEFAGIAEGRPGGAKRRHDIARLTGKGMAQRRAGLLSRDAGVLGRDKLAFWP